MTQTPAPEVAPVAEPANPEAGGCYVRDPKTGELKPDATPQPDTSKTE